jgi:hypothetical protein
MRFFTRVLIGVAAGIAVLIPALPAPAATSQPHLAYDGGRVLSHVSVDIVVWGSWSYSSTVALSGRRSITSFASGITASPYIDWLQEYNTPTQQIGRGTLDGVFTVAPPSAANGRVVTNTQIQSALAHLIGAGQLPKPSADRLFVVFFRRGQVIARAEGDSQHNFCAYHDTRAYALHAIIYAVIPYEMGNPGCRAASTSFDSLTTITSHELVEAITDPGVGLRRLAWYDRMYGEIGDICAHSSVPGAVTGGDGVRYVVQREWSNRRRTCVLTG